jgi:hypothetical protein
MESTSMVRETELCAVVLHDRKHVDNSTIILAQLDP